MKAIQVTRYGSPEALQLRELEEPQPAAGQVRIRVRAVGINFADILTRFGVYTGTPKPPFIPGLEVAGEIDAVGPHVVERQPGERVLAFTRFHGYAERVVVSESHASPFPARMSFEEAAALPVNYLTAYHAMFFMGGLKKGERILIHAAAGGVGVAATQLAKIAEAEIFGTASASKHDFIRQQGVAHAIDYHAQDFEAEVRRLTQGAGVHMVLDAVGGRSFAKSYRLLVPTGRLIVFGFSSAVKGKSRLALLRALPELLASPRFAPLDLIQTNRAVIGVHLGLLGSEEHVLAPQLKKLFEYYEQGLIRPHIDKVFPLAEAAAAHHYLQDRKSVGKLILRVE